MVWGKAKISYTGPKDSTLEVEIDQLDYIELQNQYIY